MKKEAIEKVVKLLELMKKDIEIRRSTDNKLEEALNLTIGKLNQELGEQPDKEEEEEEEEEEEPLQVFSIWSEGYQDNGGHGTATYHGTARGTDFLDAVRGKIASDKEFARYATITNGIASYWGCQLFDNEADARRRFG